MYEMVSERRAVRCRDILLVTRTSGDEGSDCAAVLLGPVTYYRLKLQLQLRSDCHGKLSTDHGAMVQVVEMHLLKRQ